MPERPRPRSSRNLPSIVSAATTPNAAQQISKLNLASSATSSPHTKVSVGVGPTKTLAKLANRLAKKSVKAGGVLDLVHHPAWIEAALRKTPVGDVWGVGKRWTVMLEERGIHTAHDFANAPDGWVRQRMGVVGLRTVHELRGLVCHALEDQPPPKQTTCCSRTFGAASRDLFGASIVEFAWGRIGTKGQERAVSFDGDDEASRFASQLLRRRASAPKRIGVAYR